MKCHKSEERSSNAPLMALLFLISIATFIVSVLVSSPAMAAPYPIHSLSSDSLLGSTNSRQELQLRMRLHETRVRTAASDLGLTTAQYQAFRTKLFHAPYVVIPRRLNAMTGYAHGTPYVLHDVIIPANSRGWEVDLVNGNEVTQVFVPALCGNLSILRSLRPRIAQLPAKRKIKVAARAPVQTVIPPAPAPAAVATPVPITTPVPIAAQTPTFQISSQPAATHHGHFPWWLALIAIPFIHGGGGTQAPAYHTPVMPTPPPVIGCKKP